MKRRGRETFVATYKRENPNVENFSIPPSCLTLFRSMLFLSVNLIKKFFCLIHSVTFYLCYIFFKSGTLFSLSLRFSR